MSDDLVTWLREQIEADRDWADARLRRQMSDRYRWEVWEKAARASAELAILDEHQPVPLSETHDGCVICVSWADSPAHLGGETEFGIALPESFPCRTVRLLASGYRHRPGYREEEWKP